MTQVHMLWRGAYEISCQFFLRERSVEVRPYKDPCLNGGGGG